ncbi:MAG: type IV secretion system DNA-binding domain-containing protein (plasmid) [Candidatus Algichlamydia australiensis]|nr:type IV secretion system DNA-binding domain-containing protein [Chlamydiales bacterium]
MGLIKILTEGGQTWAHRIRMVKQVLRLAIMISITAGTGSFITAMCKQPNQKYKSIWYCVKSKFLRNSNKRISVTSDYWGYANNISFRGERKTINVNPGRVLRVSTPIAHSLLINAMYELGRAVQRSLLVLFASLLFFFIRGLISKKKKHLSGKRVVHPFLLNMLLTLKRKKSNIKIGKVPLVKNSETQHILVTGGTGSGKTNCFHTIMPQIAKEGHRAVIVDTTGEFVERYYNSETDILLNPFDDRSAPWLPWVECTNQYDYDALAESFIPTSYSDKEDYWRNAARSLFSSLLQITRDDANISRLVQYLLYEPLDELSSILQDTKAAAHLNSNSDKTAASIRSVATSFLDCIDVLKQTENPFSIKKWVQSEGEGRLFLQCTVAQRATLNPLLSAWFSLAMRSLIQMPQSLNRRLWFIADELASLNRLRDLETCLTESRKFGGCALLAIQSPSQLDQIYGRNATSVILGNCSTRITFSEQDPEVANRISKIFGYKEVEERNEGISYGAHEMRDGVNLSTQKRKNATVPVEKIQSLKKNQAFIKLAGKFPIAKTKLPIS